MSSKTIENKLARIIQMIASNESDLENDRIALTRNPSFDPFQIFRSIDKSGKGYLSESDLALFLTNHKVFLQGKELQGVFSLKKDGTLKLTFQDFLQHVTPRSDPTLKNDIVNRIGKGENRSTYHTKGTIEDAERLVARIYKKEGDNIQQIENERYVLSSLGRAGLDESLAFLAERTTGYFTFKSVAMFLKQHHFDLSITDFESFVRRVDTSKKGRIDIEDFKYFLAPNDSQMVSNYSSIGRDNTRYDLGKSVVDSFSSPLRQLAAGGAGLGSHIRINETQMPSNMSAISPRSHQKVYYQTSPAKVLSPGNKNFMSKIDLIQAQEERINRQFDIRGVHQIEERSSRHATGTSAYSPTRQVTRTTTTYSPNRQVTRTTTNYSPPRNERETANFFSSKIASIRDNQLYQPRPQTYNTTSNIDSIRRNYGLPENSSRSRVPQDQPPLAYSTFLSKDLQNLAYSQTASNVPSSRVGYEYRSSSIQPRLHTAGDYQDITQRPSQKLSQRLSHDTRRQTEGREALSRSPIRNNRPSANLYEMKTQSYLQANIPPRYDSEILNRASYTRSEAPLSYKSGAASRYLTNQNTQNYVSGGQIRSSSPHTNITGAGGYASRLAGGYDSKQYSTAYSGSIRTNTAFAEATGGMRREEPITSHIRAEPSRISNIESQIEERRRARDNISSIANAAIRENYTSSGIGLGLTRENLISATSVGIGRENVSGTVTGIEERRRARENTSSIINTATRENLTSAASVGIGRENFSGTATGMAERRSPNGIHGSAEANRIDYTNTRTSPLIKQEPVREFTGTAASASSNIHDQIEKRQKAREGFNEGRSPSSLRDYTGTSPIRDPYRISSQLETINETRGGILKHSPPRLDTFKTDVEKKSSMSGYSSYQINETAAYPYPKSATSTVTFKETTVTKTEGDQPGISSSSYRFSNPRYEQLWSQ